jgi:hypothetical protein
MQIEQIDKAKAHAESQRKYHRQKIDNGWRRLQFWVPPDSIDDVVTAVKVVLKQRADRKG